MVVMRRARSVVRWMVERSALLEDGRGVFHGSPRAYMETIGVSSGPLYEALQRMGIRRKGRGASAIWIIPRHIMEEHERSIVK